MDTTDPPFDQQQLEREQTREWSGTVREFDADEIDIRALLLDESNPELELLHNLMMMC
jgi:hypothetical protein